MQIRGLERSDYEAWLPLMQENCEHKVAEDILKHTWLKILNPKEKLGALGAFNDAGELQGFLHYVLHSNTAFLEDACYMQDLYVPKNARRQGIAKRLVWELNSLGKAQKWTWIYWFVENDNIAAQNLYKTLGIKMNFSLHMMATKD